MVAGEPEQTVVLVAASVTIGIGLTVISMLVSFEQPPLVTPTVYVVLATGVTVMLDVVAELLQEYVPPPVAVILAD